MKVTTPEIVWHSKEPLLSADFHRGESTSRLATGGADNDVKIWKLSKDEGGEKSRIHFMASLSRHSKAVNVVRFSPNGEYLASAGDDTVVHIWKMCAQEGSLNGSIGGNLATGSNGSSPSKNKENWSLVKLLRGHLEDIYDVCWSPDSSYLISGSVDNSAIIWDVQKGQQIAVLKESRQYIQGVAWDPLGDYVATLSTDRNLRVYSVDQKFKCLHTVNKLTLTDSKHIRLWVDEVNSFFRRLAFTPDGSFLIAPAGRFESEDKVVNASYVFTRNNWTKPVLQLPGSDKATVAVRCCPVLFELMDQPEGSTPLTSLTYRMVYAVASLDSVLLYDTQHTAPFAYVSKIHYSGITDLTWSDDGLTLVITSSDCYCTIVTFDPNELGIPLPKEKLPASILASGKTAAVDNPSPPVVAAKSAKNTSKITTDVEDSGRKDIKQDGCKTPSPTSSSSEPRADSAASTIVSMSNLAKPRRIRPTMVSSITSPNGKTETVSSSPVSQTVSSPQPASTPVTPSPLPTHSTPTVTESDNINSQSSCEKATPEQSHVKESGKTGSPQNVTACKIEPSVSSSSNKDGGVKPSSQSGPRRVSFTTLSAFSNMSSKTQAVTVDSTSSEGKTTNSKEEDCIVIE